MEGVSLDAPCLTCLCSWHLKEKERQKKEREEWAAKKRSRQKEGWEERAAEREARMAAEEREEGKQMLIRELMQQERHTCEEAEQLAEEALRGEEEAAMEGGMVGVLMEEESVADMARTYRSH